MTRGSLAKFKKYLDIENPNHFCFFTGKEIPDGSLSIDHVLPWSYLFSDDLWNLVYVDRSVNSAKGNKIPTKSHIAGLNARNLRLLESRSGAKNKDKQTEELRLPIDSASNLMRGINIAHCEADLAILGLRSRASSHDLLITDTLAAS